MLSAHSFVTPNKNSENTQNESQRNAYHRKIDEIIILPMMTIRRFLSSSPTPSMVVFDRNEKEAERSREQESRRRNGRFRLFKGLRSDAVDGSIDGYNERVSCSCEFGV